MFIICLFHPPSAIGRPLKFDYISPIICQRSPTITYIFYRLSNDHMSFIPFVWNISIALPRIFFRALTATMCCSTSNYVTLNHLIQFSTCQPIQPKSFIPSIQSPPYNPTTIGIALEISFPSRPLHQPVHLKSRTY